jgi:desulfoferrodoxin-like iron-binding protein
MLILVVKFDVSIKLIVEVKNYMETAMEKLGDLFQEADWKKEKHVPVIECPAKIKKDEMFDVKISIGKEIAHPNTTEHHIAWVSCFLNLKTKNILITLDTFCSMPMAPQFRDQTQARFLPTLQLPHRLKHQNPEYSMRHHTVISMDSGSLQKKYTSSDFEVNFLME